MAHKYQYEQFGVYYKFEETVEPGADYKIHQSFHNFPNIEKLRYLLIDTLDVTVLDPAVPYVFSSIDNVASHSIKKLNLIFVTDNDDYKNAFKIYKERMSESGWRFQICSTLEEGRAIVEELKLTS